MRLLKNDPFICPLPYKPLLSLLIITLFYAKISPLQRSIPLFWQSLITLFSNLHADPVSITNPDPTDLAMKF